MTKPRPPLSIDAALARIAGQLPGGWKEMAQVADRAESTVRAWGDPDKPDEIPLACAVRLDIAHEQAGGAGRPLFETYALQVNVARELVFASEIALARRACVLIRESAQAHEAMVLATLPPETLAAGARSRSTAIRELEDVAREVTASIALLQAAEQARPPPPDTS